ncbi:MAG TPA: Uma2 family endonuclease [Thermoanaerobaculia bacterium]|jgi:Uma2 family endonuclease
MAIPEIRRWTREDYERMAEQGYFRPDERVELVDGVIYEMTPQNSWHASAIQAAQEALGPAFRKGYSLRIQMPLALGSGSEPEPDLAVVRGHWRDFREAHPTTAALVLEIADSTVFHDRERKSAIYAQAGIPDYWILNRLEACLEVHRDPKGGAYQTRRILRAGETISPLARPEISILVAELLP